MIGRVVSTKMKYTVSVLVERVAMNPLYKKTYVQSKKYLVDDPIGVKTGDVVDFINCRPISKNKHWKITKVLGRSFAEIAEDELKKEAEEVIAQVMPEEKTEELSSPLGAHSPQTKKVTGKKEKRPKKKGSGENGTT